MALDSTLNIKSVRNTDTPAKTQVCTSLSNGANVLVAATVGKQIQITGIVLSTDTAGVYTLNSGSDPIMVFCMAANSVFGDSISVGALFSSSSGENLNMTVSGSPGNAAIYLQYKVL